MSFLNDMASKAMGAVTGGGQQSGLVAAVLEYVKSQPGGFSGLVQKFHTEGLGGIVESWIGTGQNQPISAEQIQKVLGSDVVKNLAAKVGISPEEASSKLSEILPTLVDKLTPDGKVPEGGDLMQQAASFLGGKA